MLILAVLIICGIIRSVLGPKIADRIIAVNMIGTLTIILIAILSVYLGENYLVDVCLIYAMISFLAVVVLCKVTRAYICRERESARTIWPSTTIWRARRARRHRSRSIRR